MSNLSKERRAQMIEFLDKLRQEHSDDTSMVAINAIENFINEKKYGLVWEEHSERVDEEMIHNIPVFSEIVDKRITVSDSNYNFLLEGDNLHSLKLLEKTHRERIDVIYIDPPYNRGKKDFKYDDDYVDKEDTFRHSKWLSFMNQRIAIARNLLSKTGIIIIHIDENEYANLLPLMNELFGEENSLGEIIWNKMNPKGDAKSISTMHETIVVYAKDKGTFGTLESPCMRPKPNANLILAKAKSLFNMMGRKAIPAEVEEAIKPFDYPDEVKRNFLVEYDLDLINREFGNWIKRQDFSGGEKAYRFINDEGRVYRGVSMAWPNKQTAPDEYFIPLIHPTTGRECPVPARGWRNPPATMKSLLEQGRILFGADESKQPERIYYLDENMYENTPSIYENADSADSMLEALRVQFEYAKPVSVAKYVLSSIHPNPKIILDFFAGSGTTGHAVMQLNKEDGGNRRYILCTNNENEICENVTYQRLQNIQEELPHNLKYFKTEFIPKLLEDEDILSDRLLAHIKEMVELESMCEIDGEKNILVLSDEDMDAAMVNSLVSCERIYLPSYMLLTREQENLISGNGIQVIDIPDYYFMDELKGAGEI